MLKKRHILFLITVWMWLCCASILPDPLHLFHSEQSDAQAPVLAREALITPWTDPNILLQIISVVVTSVLTVVSILVTLRGYQENRRVMHEQQELARKEAQHEKEAKEKEHREFISTATARYHARLLQDEAMSSIKILDMPEPITLEHIHVGQRLRPLKKTDPGLEMNRGDTPERVFHFIQQSIEEEYLEGSFAPEEVLRDKKHIIVLGDPGSGKTTLLKYMLSRALKDQLNGLHHLLPIAVELSRFARSQQDNLLDFLADDWHDNHGFPTFQEARAFLEDQFSKGKVLLLLDALDEAILGNKKSERQEAYRRVFEAIKRCCSSYPAIYLIVTSRLAEYKYEQRAPLPFAEYEILPFRKQEAHEFIGKWFQLEGPEDRQRIALGEELKEVLDNTPQLEMLASNPLLLSLLVMLYERNKKLPTRLADLYARCIELLLYEWDQERLHPRYTYALLTVEQKKRLLSKVAWHFHQQRQRYFTEERLSAVVSQFLEQETPSAHSTAHQIIDELCSDNGLIKKQNDGAYGFLHLTFQSYFAALSIVEARTFKEYALQADTIEQLLLKELLQHPNDLWNEEVLLMYAGIIQDLSPLLEQLLNRKGMEDVFSITLILAGHCLVAHHREGEEPPAQQQEIIDRLLQVLHETPYTQVRQEVAKTLVKLAGIDTALHTHLFELIYHPTSKRALTESLLHAIGISGSSDDVEKLLPLFLHPETAADLRRILTDIFNRRYYDTVIKQNGILTTALLKILDDTRASFEFRHDIIRLFEQQEAPDIAPQLMALVLDPSEDTVLRIQAAILLANSSDSTTRARLVAHMNSEPQDESTPRCIAVALTFTTPQKILPQDRQRAAHILLDYLFAPPATDAESQLLKEVMVNFFGLPGISVLLEDTAIRQKLYHYLKDRNRDAEERRYIASLLTASIPIAPQRTRRLAAMLIQELQALTTELDHDGLRKDIEDLRYLLGDKHVPFDPSAYLKAAQSFLPVQKQMIRQLERQERWQLLRDRSLQPDIRAGIVQVLVEENDTVSIASLRRLVEEVALPLPLRREVVNALGLITNENKEEEYETARVLIQLANRDKEVRDVAMEALWYVSRRIGVQVVRDRFSRRLLLQP
uniref:NACHT domain-containing protein n=1 Tax=Thermosporothrix sp. COM3 TaxID=2490863 RepID=A0A455SQI4_9CHLR|nr:hypothetical protein KTC_54440 [Thermosporothrix sp. COM3]